MPLRKAGAVSLESIAKSVESAVRLAAPGIIWLSTRRHSSIDGKFLAAD
jgi:hypothetical protein